MPDPAYIAIADDGHITLFWGDGTEPYKEVILRGPRVTDHRELILVIEDMKAWAEDHGYVVVVPAYDLEATDIEIELPEEDAEHLTMADVDDLLDDLDMADDYDDGKDDASYYDSEC
jgi:hypothetical protein